MCRAVFENASPDDGAIWLDGRYITLVDFIKFLRFENSDDAIEGARCLREAIKQITDRIGIPPTPGIAMKSYSEVFATQSTWKLDPGVDFDIASSMLSYWEYVCADGSDDCVTKVKQECQGLVEWVGSDSTEILDYINIYFNQPISGRATLISK